LNATTTTEVDSSSQEEFADRRLNERRQSTARTLAASLVVFAVLYVARQVFIPLALAILFAFLLRPVVGVLEKTFLRRFGAVLIAMTLALSLFGAGAWALLGQTNQLIHEFAEYSGNLERKLAIFTDGREGTLEIIERTLQRITERAERAEDPEMRVRVVTPQTMGERYRQIAPMIEVIATAFLVLFLVFFLLKERERMREKILRLAGRAHITVTSQAISEATERIGRFLLTLLLINISYGVLIGAGLYFLQMPHWLLWAVLSALLRFIPYIGAVISAALPVILALGYFPDWFTPLVILALFVIVDQVVAGYIEPSVVGHRVGVSPVALLLSAIFWAWLWGPVGLLLATPITVCLTVGGEFIPALRIFSILFGREAPLEGYLNFYNRLLVRDRSGAARQAERFADEQSLAQVYDELFVPTLAFAAGELERGRITRAHDHLIKDSVRGLIHRLGDRDAAEPSGLSAIAVAIGGERISLGTLMMIQLLRSDGYRVDSFNELTGRELELLVEQEGPSALIVSSSAVRSSDEAIELVRIIHERFPSLPIIASGSALVERMEETREAGASAVVATPQEGREEILRRSRR
jgi:predicted PurR-regulated permease PerM